MCSPFLGSFGSTPASLQTARTAMTTTQGASGFGAPPSFGGGAGFGSPPTLGSSGPLFGGSAGFAMMGGASGGLGSGSAFGGSSNE